MSQWIYRIEPASADLAIDLTDEQTAIFAERDGYLQALKAAGILVLAGVTNPTRGEWGATIFTAPDEESARAVMNTDPSVSSGVMTATLFPFAVTPTGRGVDDTPPRRSDS